MPTRNALEPAQHAHTQPLTPGFSLLRASTGQRLLLVGVLLVLLWAAVFWAM